MRRVALAALPLLWLVAACGKVGAPLPPIKRTPQKVTDLAVAQAGYNVVLTWTNPALYIDGNPALDPAVVRILRNGVQVGTAEAGGAGQPQSYSVDAKGDLGVLFGFEVVVEPRRGEPSALSNSVSIRPVEVPGSPRELQAKVDQFRITLTWQAPEQRADLASAYAVQRQDRAATDIVQGLSFEDRYSSDPGKTLTYTYTVQAVSGRDPRIPGLPGVSLTVVATDVTRPATPSGLQIVQAGEGVFLTWNANTEEDLARYLVFRSDLPDKPMPTSATGLPDPAYRSGLTYQLAAEDVFGNRSLLSAPQAGP